MKKKVKKFAMGGDVDAGDNVANNGAYQTSPGPTIAQTNTMPTAQPNTMNVGGDALGSQFPSMGFKKGGKVSSASKRADGIAVKGKTRGRLV